METVRAGVQTISANKIPGLKELFTPCPICGGTIDVDLRCYIFCHSCRQEWTLIGEPIGADSDMACLRRVDS